MRTAVIVDAVRTPIGRRNGMLKDWHPVDLAAETIGALVKRSEIDPAVIEDVILGCTIMAGEQALNIARNAVLAAGLPQSVPGTSVDRQCGSAQQAIHFAAQAVMSGAMDVVIAGGVESMTRVPAGPTLEAGPGDPYSNRLRAQYELVNQGVAAELIAEKWGVSREEMDELSLASHQRAAIATAEARFDDEIVPVQVGSGVFAVDEGIRRDTTLDKLASLRPVFSETGRITAGSASQISDGASALLVMSESKALALGVRARARFHSFAVAADDPILMLTAPIPATTMILEKAGLSLDDIDVIEINEAFASVVLAWAREHHPDMTRVNPNGGAIALGHPTGCSGARIMATMLNELERTGGRYGLQTMCEGGGMANATIIERL